MRLPRVRFTVRRLMVAVAVFAVGFGGVAWVASMRALSAAYERRAEEFQLLTARMGSMVTTPDGRWVSRYDDENDLLSDAWAMRLAVKYQRLSYYPWLAVEPDLPPPEPLAHPRSARDVPERDDSPARSFFGSRPPAWTFPWTWRW